MTSSNSFLPRWTKRAVIQGSGRDPLGLSLVSDAFTDLLLPAIITTTNRARYYSFYPWALRESAEASDGGDGEKSFVEEFRKREAAFAIASKLSLTTNLTIVGVEQVNRHISEVTDGSVSTTFRVLPSNDWGGFGQYYGGCLASLGLGSWDEDGLWKVSETRGRKLADAFADAVADTPYVKSRGGSMRSVPLSLLVDSAADFSLDGIRGDAAEAERTLLTRILFEIDEDRDTSGPTHRQATLGQFLHVLDACEAIASSPDRNDASDSYLFWPHYYGRLYGADEKSVPYSSHPAFAESGLYWRQFCAHQFFTYAAEQLLQAILDAVSGSPDGLTKPELIETMIGTGFIPELEDATDARLEGPADLMKAFHAGDEAAIVQEEFSADHNLAEWWIYDGNDEADIATRLGRAFAILTQLHAKWRLSDDASLSVVAEKAGNEWWLGTCFQWGDDWMADKHDWTMALDQLIDEVHSRHELVRFQKHKLDAAWMEKIGDRYFKIQDLTPGFRANRHNNAATILKDLCVLKDSGLEGPLQLTAAGRDILAKVIQARS